MNVPAFAKTDMGMLPMSSTFNKLVGITFPDKQTKLVVGCQVLVMCVCVWGGAIGRWGADPPPRKIEFKELLRQICGGPRSGEG